MFLYNTGSTPNIYKPTSKSSEILRKNGKFYTLNRRTERYCAANRINGIQRHINKVTGLVGIVSCSGDHFLPPDAGSAVVAAPQPFPGDEPVKPQFINTAHDPGSCDPADDRLEHGPVLHGAVFLQKMQFQPVVGGEKRVVHIFLFQGTGLCQLSQFLLGFQSLIAVQVPQLLMDQQVRIASDRAGEVGVFFFAEPVVQFQVFKSE